MTFLRNHAEGIASIGLFFVRIDCGGISGSDTMHEAVVDPNQSKRLMWPMCSY